MTRFKPQCLSWAMTFSMVWSLGCGGVDGSPDEQDPSSAVDAGTIDPGTDDPIDPPVDPDPEPEPPLVINDPEPPEAVLCLDEPGEARPVALAKNIILLMGDGMGPYQVRAGRINNGGVLAWDRFNGPVFLNTDSLTTDGSSNPDLFATDSAASATAMATGTRVINRRLSITASGEELETVLEKAQARGKATGLVTTSTLYDASPMAFATHVYNRGAYSTIVQQLLQHASPDVLLGGAGTLFNNYYINMAHNAGYHIVRDAEELTDWNPASHAKVLGIFDSGMSSWPTTPVALRDGSSPDPTLPAMVDRALDRLSQDPDGFFLFVENENIDSIGHLASNDPDFAHDAMPHEVAELSASVQVAIDWVEANSSFDETLIVLAADHECGEYFLADDTLDSGDYSSSTHSRRPIALWALGPGSDDIESLCRISDVHALLTGTEPNSRVATIIP